MAKTKTPPDGLGAVGLHRWRMENDSEYADAALTAPIGTRGKYLTNTAPITPLADRDKAAKKNERTEAQRDGHAIADESLKDNA